MLLRELYQILDTLANQDGTDTYFDLDDFNRLIVQEEINLMIEAVEEERRKAFNERPMTDAILQARTFTADDTGLPYDFELPTGYLRMEKCLYIDANSVKHNVDFVSAAEHTKRLDDLLSPPIAENYTCYIEEGDSNNPGRYLMFRPILGVGTWGIFFLGRRTVYSGGVWSLQDPFLDYYIDTNYEVQFIDEGVDLSTITTGTYRDGTTMLSQTGTSATYELYIPVDFHHRFMERMMERLGIKDRDQLMASYSMNKDREDAVKNRIT
jgi:hypothetical protein